MNRLKRHVYVAHAIKGDTSWEGAFEVIEGAVKEAGRTLGVDIGVYSEEATDETRLVSKGGWRDVFKRDQEWLRNSDLLVAEVSGESFGVGWEVAYAQQVMLIPVLCLASSSAHTPALIAGNTHRGLTLQLYATRGELRRTVGAFVVQEFGGGPADNGAAGLVEDQRGSVFDILPDSTWIEGEASMDEGILSLFTLLPEAGHPGRDTVLHLFSRLCDYRSLAIKSFLDSRSLFRHASTRMRQLRRAVLFQDASTPSTDLGWLTCHAQWNNVQCLAAYGNGAEVSWLILGQSSGRDGVADPLVFRRKGQTRLPSSERRPGSYDLRPRERPPVTPIPFLKESELLDRVHAALELIAQSYHSTEIPEQLQRTLGGFQDGNGDERGPWNWDRESQLLVECIIRDALWPDLTRKGIEGTFLSGERTEVIALLKYHNFSPSPQSFYSKVKHAVNYEEKAFAKNLRALKDVGILLKLGGEGNGGTQKRDVRQARLPTQTKLTTFGPREENESPATFVENQLILTDFGAELSEYIVANRRRPGILMSVLSQTRSKAQELLGPYDFTANVSGKEFILKEVPEPEASALLRMAGTALVGLREQTPVGNTLMTGPTDAGAS